ncbi:MAG: hypothetical protein ACYDHY_09925 [Acidiferrobacterales bacterium]
MKLIAEHGWTEATVRRAQHLMEEGRPLSGLMPIHAKIQWTDITVSCPKCGDVIADHNTRWVLTPGLCQVQPLDFLGYCDACNLVTFNLMRLYPDGRVAHELSAGRWAALIREQEVVPWWDFVGRLQQVWKRIRMPERTR